MLMLGSWWISINNLIDIWLLNPCELLPVILLGIDGCSCTDDATCSSWVPSCCCRCSTICTCLQSSDSVIVLNIVEIPIFEITSKCWNFKAWPSKDCFSHPWAFLSTTEWKIGSWRSCNGPWSKRWGRSNLFENRNFSIATELLRLATCYKSELFGCVMIRAPVIIVWIADWCRSNGLSWCICVCPSHWTVGCICNWSLRCFKTLVAPFVTAFSFFDCCVVVSVSGCSFIVPFIWAPDPSVSNTLEAT